MTKFLTRLGLMGLLTLTAGCGAKSDAIPVTGVLQSNGINLSGQTVEVARSDDPTVRGFASISESGQLEFNRLDNGSVEPGLKPGNYSARLVIVDEGDGRTAKPKVPARFRDFKKSGWTLSVPPAQPVTFTVAAK